MNNPHWNKQKYILAILGISTICFSVTGCGEPDILSMQPTVSKLAAEVLLVDAPQNWKANDLINAASDAGVDTYVKNIKATEMTTALNEIVKNNRVGLCQVVFDGSVPDNVMSIPTQNTNVKFEFVSDGMNHIEGSNVQNVYVDPTSTGFIIGFGAGSLAAGMGQYTVGWLTSGSTLISKKEIEATIGGFYQADSKASMIPVTVGNQGAVLPHILISDHVLSNTELQAVSQSGSVVFSLVKASVGPAFAAWPAFVEENAVMQDFSMFASSTWKPGDRPIEQPQSVYVNVQVLPQNVSQNVQTEENVMAGNTGVVQGAYTSIPDPLKVVFGAIVNLGT